MPIYKAPLEDVNFLLNDVFQIDRYDNLPGFSDASDRRAGGDSVGGGETQRTGVAAAQPRRRSRGLYPP